MTRKRVVIWTAAALLVGLGAAWDAATGLQRLPSSARAALLLGAAGLLAWAWTRPRAPRPALAAMGLVLLSLGTGAWSDLRRRAAARDWEARARSRLQAQADDVQQEFHAFLRRLRMPAEILAGRRYSEAFATDLRPASSLFHLVDRLREGSGLPESRFGVTLFNSLGQAAAWSGHSSILPSAILNRVYTRESVVVVRDTGAVTQVIHLSQVGDSGNALAAEYLVRHRVEPGPPPGFLPSLPADPAAGEISFQDHLTSTAELEEFFSARGDRHWSVGAGPPAVTFPLRAPDDRILAHVTLRAPPADASLPAVRARDGGIAAGLVTLALALLGAWGARRWAAELDASRAPGWWTPPARFALLSACLWGTRLLLSRGGFPQKVWRLHAFDFDVFGSRALGGLVVSPADLFLTGAALLGQAALLAMLLRGLSDAWGHRRTGGTATPDGGLRAAGFLLAVGLLAVAVVRLFRALADHVIARASIDFLKIDFTGLSSEHLLLQSGLLLILLAGLLLVAAVLFLGGSRIGLIPLTRFGILGIPRELPLRLALVPTVAAATLVYFPVAVQAYDVAVKTFYEQNLMPGVLHQRDQRTFVLDSSAAAVENDAVLAEALASGLPRNFEELAFDAWFRTPLASEGYDSSLEILDAAGRLLGSFALNVRGSEQEDLDDSEQVQAEILRGRVDRQVLHVERPLHHDGRLVGYVRLHISDAFDNLPFLASSDPYAQVFRTARRPAPEETAGGATLLYAYDMEGNAIPHGTTAPVLPDGFRPLPPGEWLQATSPAGKPLDLLVSAAADGTFALGHPSPELLLRAGAFVRFLLLHVMEAAAVLLLIMVATGVRDPSRLRLSALVDSLGRSYYRKLFASFLAASLIPLLSLALFLQGFISREIRKEIVAQGSVALEAAGRILSRYSEPEPGGGSQAIEDSELEILRDVVGRDLHLYVEESLLATSRRELVSAGLLSAQLDGTTFREIYLDGQAISAAQETARGFEYTLLAAPVTLGNLTAILALPVRSRPMDVEDQVAKVGEAILIATAIMVLLLAATGFLVARLISAPILRLVTATLRVARGDLDTRVEIRSRDETASLASSFNEMSRALKQRDEELRNNLVYIRKILDNATTGVISLDEGRRIVTINAAAERLLEVGGRPRPGEDLGRFLQGPPALQELHGAFHRAGREPRGEHRAEVDLRDPDGERETQRLRAVFVPFPLEEGRPGQILLLEDITDVVRSNRLAAWAEMARRIAHEIKNPLTPIQLAVGHVRKVYQKRAPARGDADERRFGATLEECLAIILEQVQQLRRISSEFSDYARIPATRREPTDMETLIGEVLRPYAASLPESVELERRVAPDLPAVLLDPDLMRRTLVNLVENSLQAMPEGGRLSVSACRRDRNGHAWLEIAVADTGVGVDEEGLERLFEPYFSTKQAGTGLGLAIARKAVEEHGGEIRAESEPGAGTTFRIWLPLGPEAPAAGRGRRRAAS